VSSRSLLISSLSALIDLVVESMVVDSVVVIVMSFSKFFVVVSVVRSAFCSFFFVNGLKVNPRVGGAVIVVLEPKGTGGVSFPMVGMHVEFRS